MKEQGKLWSNKSTIRNAWIYTDSSCSLCAASPVKAFIPRFSVTPCSGPHINAVRLSTFWERANGVLFRPQTDCPAVRHKGRLSQPVSVS
jgi:hypothetical protein